MKTLVLIATTTITLSSVFAQDGIPRDSAELLEKFEEFAKAERAAAEKKIAQKKEQVILLLTQHALREGKSGNTEISKELRSIVANLEAEDPPQRDSRSPEPKSSLEIRSSPLTRPSLWLNVYRGGNKRVLVIYKKKGVLLESNGNIYSKNRATVVDEETVNFTAPRATLKLEDGNKLVDFNGIHWELIE